VGVLILLGTLLSPGVGGGWDRGWMRHQVQALWLLPHLPYGERRSLDTKLGPSGTNRRGPSLCLSLLLPSPGLCGCSQMWLGLCAHICGWARACLEGTRSIQNVSRMQGRAVTWEGGGGVHVSGTALLVLLLLFFMFPALHRIFWYTGIPVAGHAISNTTRSVLTSKIKLSALLAASIWRLRSKMKTWRRIRGRLEPTTEGVCSSVEGKTKNVLDAALACTWVLTMAEADSLVDFTEHSPVKWFLLCCECACAWFRNTSVKIVHTPGMD